MGRTVTQNADLRFRGRDDGASKTIKKVKDSVSRLPDSFGKSATALKMFSGASTQMGGSVADTASKLTNVGALIATGGPVGIAIAAGTVLVGGLTVAWTAANAEFKAAKSQTKHLSELFTKFDAEIKAMASNVERLSERLTTFGMGAIEARRTLLELESTQKTKAIPALEEMIAKLEAVNKERESGIVSFTAEGAAIKKKIALDKIVISRLKQRLLQQKNFLAESGKELIKLDALEKKEKAAERSKRRTAEASRAAAKAERERLAAEKKAAAERAAANKAAEDRLKTLYGEREVFLKAHAEWRHNLAVKSTNEEIELTDKGTKHLIKQKEKELQAQRALVSGMVSTWGSGIAQLITLDREHEAERKAGRDVELSASQLAAREEINRAREVRNARLNLILDSVQTAVNAYAIQAGASAGASFAWAPPLIPVAAAAAIAVIKALLTQMPSYQLGGVVPGIDTGRDSVIAAMRPNERVFSPEHNERMVRALEGGGGVGSPTIIFQSLAPPTSAEASRAARATLKVLRRAEARGY